MSTYKMLHQCLQIQRNVTGLKKYLSGRGKFFDFVQLLLNNLANF